MGDIGSTAIDFSRLSARGVIAALSRALDLTEGEPLGHSMRTLWLGMALAEALQLDKALQNQLYFALLLKDCGCSANSHQVSSWFGTDDRTAKRDLKTVNWAKLADATRYAIRNARPGARPWERLAQIASLAKRGPGAARSLVELRCTRGSEIVRELGFTDLTPDAVLHLDEHWDGRGHPIGLRAEEIPLLSRILLLSQTAEIFWNRLGAEAARAAVAERRGTWFDPELADAFLAISRQENFFSALGMVDLSAVIHLDLPDTSVLNVRDIDGLLAIARVFGQIVDAKSPWTALHSVRTAHYAKSIAEAMGLSPGQADQILLTGFFHDLGKLGVSNVVLDKPGPLDAGERRQIERHAELTHEILSPILGLEGIAQAAGGHHERLDGSGYYRHLQGDEVPLASQIVAVADVFDALTAERPYRPGLTREQTLEIMDRERGRIFGRVSNLNGFGGIQGMQRRPRIIVVTGGGQGIGRAIVDLFDQEKGWQPIAVDWDQEALAELPQSIWSYQADVSDPLAVAGLVDWLGQRTDQVGALVNNAGVGYQRPLAEVSLDEWQRVISINLTGAFWMVKSLLPLLKASTGASVVQMASTRAMMSEPNTEAYGASKGGILALTHALAVSLSSDGIRVNAISPGWIVAEPWKKLSLRHQPQLSEQDHRQHPSGRAGTPPDIARAVRFLVDPGNDFINGANLVIDGGMTIKMIYAQD